MRRRGLFGLGVAGAVLGSSLLLGASAPAAMKSGISATVRAKLLKVALSEASRYSERHPSDIQAVLTTETEAQKLESAGRSYTVVSPQPGNSPVYLIEMRGRFRVKCHDLPNKVPPCPAARDLMLTVSVSTGKVLGSETGYGYIPSLDVAGNTPVYLRP
jgi:hypothetical protein